MIAAAALVLVCLSSFMNARGATSYDAWMWNVWPDSVDTSPEKIWDWTRPQFLAGLIAPPLPATLPVLQQRVLMGYREAEPLMRYGWSGGENNFRWSDGHEAAIAFANDATRDSSLAFKLGAFVISGKLNVQHVKVLLNGSPLAELVIDTEPAREYSYHIDHTLLKGRNTLVFRLPDAASPKSIGVSDDERRLAIRIEWIELLPSQSSKLMHEIPVVSWR